MSERNNTPVQEEVQTGESLSELLQIRRNKLNELMESGQNPYEITRFDVDAHAKEIVDGFDNGFEGRHVSIAGRIMSWRDMGKANFIDLQDGSGRIQIYVKINEIGEEAFRQFGKWDLGDIIGVEGEVFRTRRGEISVKAEKLTLLSKSQRPLPEKWHDLKDTDARKRQRYLDLLVNPNVM